MDELDQAQKQVFGEQVSLQLRMKKGSTDARCLSNDKTQAEPLYQQHSQARLLAPAPRICCSVTPPTCATSACS